MLLYVQNSGARYKCVILGPSGVKPDMGICVSNCTESLLYGCIVCSLRLGDWEGWRLQSLLFMDLSPFGWGRKQPSMYFHLSAGSTLHIHAPISETFWLWDLLKLSNNVQSEMALVYATRCNWVPNWGYPNLGLLMWSIYTWITFLGARRLCITMWPVCTQFCLWASWSCMAFGLTVTLAGPWQHLWRRLMYYSKTRIELPIVSMLFSLNME